MDPYKMKKKTVPQCKTYKLLYSATSDIVYKNIFFSLLPPVCVCMYSSMYYMYLSNPKYLG